MLVGFVSDCMPGMRNIFAGASHRIATRHYDGL